MSTINHNLLNEERLTIHRKNSLQALQTVMKHLHNIDGIGLVQSQDVSGLRDGLIIVIEISQDRLTDNELQVLSHIGIDLPMAVDVDRINLDMDDIKKLEQL